MEKIILTDVEPGMNPNSDELARVIVDRLGLNPRKENSTKDMYRTFLEFYERAKQAAQQKNPEVAVITVEEMAIYARISRQTMYDYLRRWTHLNLIIKTSYIKDGKVIIGYKLNGSTLENAFEKARVKIQNNLDLTQKYVSELQRVLKNEKISKSQRSNQGYNGYDTRAQEDNDDDGSSDVDESSRVMKTARDNQSQKRVVPVQRQQQFPVKPVVVQDQADNQKSGVQKPDAMNAADSPIPVIPMPAPPQQSQNQSAQEFKSEIKPQDYVKKEVPYINSDAICFRDNNPVLNVKEGSSDFIVSQRLNNDVVRLSDEKFQSGYDNRKKLKMLNISKIVNDPKASKDNKIEIIQKPSQLDSTTEYDNSGDDFEIDDHDEKKNRVIESKGSYEDKNLGTYNNVTNNFG